MPPILPRLFYVLTALVALAVSSFFLLDALFPLDQDRLFKPQSVRIYDNSKRLIHMGLSSDGFWRFAATKEEIPELLRQAVLSFEDRFFYYHPGINPVALLQALAHNAKHRRKIGGSTISMQVARMMHRRQRTLTNKVIELFSALQLEYHYSKDEIFNFYLNIAPYGGNIEGIKTAAFFYFDKPLSSLSVSEIALLTTIPKNPNANRPDRAHDLLGKRQRVVTLLVEQGVISAGMAERALREPLQRQRRQFSSKVPHFSQRSELRQANRSEIVSTIDGNLQQLVASKLAHTITRLRPHGVNNGAVLIIHNPTMTIRAYVGSNDFMTTPMEGQNDGVKMLRSPGSALKPFIYARALDKGLITPQQQIFDIPLHLAGYTPHNFDRRFNGIVTAAEALQWSLNIPAIELNLLLEGHSLYELLQQCGFQSINQKKSYYGSGIAIGGLEISLLHLTHLYTSLANQGQLLPLKFFAGQDGPAKDVEIVSPGAAYLISEILAQGNRHEFSAYWDSSRDMPKVAFKTGTSSKSRDLYTLGYNKDFTVGVWVGNFDGRPTNGLTGIEVASSIMFEIFRRLEQEGQFNWLPRPPALYQEQVCVDALRQDGQCTALQQEWLIAGVTRKSPCQFLRPGVLEYLLTANMLTSIADLTFHPCYDYLTAQPPRIVSPHDQAIIISDATIKKEFSKVLLQCYSFQEDPAIYWFIDQQRPLAAYSGHKTFVSLAAGNHTVGCLDSQANMSRHHIQVVRK